MRKRLLTITLVAGALAFTGCAKDEIQQAEINLKNSVVLEAKGNRLLSEKNEFIPYLGSTHITQKLIFEKIGSKINIYESVDKNDNKLFTQVKSVDAKNCSDGYAKYENISISKEDVPTGSSVASESELVKYERGYKSHVNICLASKDTLTVESDFSYFEPVVTR